MYYVFEIRNEGLIARPKITEKIVYATEDLSDASRYEDKLRRTYKDRTVVDCCIKSDEDILRAKRISESWNSLPKGVA